MSSLPYMEQRARKKSVAWPWPRGLPIHSKWPQARIQWLRHSVPNLGKAIPPFGHGSRGLDKQPPKSPAKTQRIAATTIFSPTPCTGVVVEQAADVADHRGRGGARCRPVSRISPTTPFLVHRFPDCCCAIIMPMTGRLLQCSINPRARDSRPAADPRSWPWNTSRDVRGSGP